MSGYRVAFYGILHEVTILRKRRAGNRRLLLTAKLRIELGLNNGHELFFTFDLFFHL